MSAFSIIVIGLIIFGIYKYAVFASIGSHSFLESKPEDLTEYQKEQIYQLWSKLTGINLNLELKSQFFESKQLPRIGRHSIKNQTKSGQAIVEKSKKWHWTSFDPKPKPLDLKVWADLLDRVANRNFRARGQRSYRGKVRTLRP